MFSCGVAPWTTTPSRVSVPAPVCWSPAQPCVHQRTRPRVRRYGIGNLRVSSTGPLEPDAHHRRWHEALRYPLAGHSSAAAPSRAGLFWGLYSIMPPETQTTGVAWAPGIPSEVREDASLNQWLGSGAPHCLSSPALLYYSRRSTCNEVLQLHAARGGGRATAIHGPSLGAHSAADRSLAPLEILSAEQVDENHAGGLSDPREAGLEIRSPAARAIYRQSRGAG